ncbi:aspartic peptidase domain-containing protein [Multifurca ochricompacta]|uniref:Aspartic peptidase domain-containing protein n=1 Tax=Multifurca ochricompacta TaxID=376703 RepID=A0AAD4QQ10_9AGAM|nr:aspartic peptidase domain-containing protein [Multifurca ochricompacta]
MTPRPCILAALILHFFFYAHVIALRFNIRGELLNKRGHISALDNGQNLKYFTNITLGQTSFSVSIDTGSSDLWVAGNVPNSNDTGISTGVEYAIGAISGHVKTAPLAFLDFYVPDQAFIQVQPSSAYPEGQGLIGLGPNVGSNIHDALNKKPRGDTVLDRIFRQNSSTPNFLTVLLSRSNDPAGQYPGEITVSDILPGMENITSQPKLTVKAVPSSRSGDQHWQVLLDPNGIIGPDGQPIAFKTKVSKTKNPWQLTTVIDTGFTFNQVPKAVSDAIYSRIPEAKFENISATGPIWTIPCTTEVNTTIIFGNKSYPIHPLDMNFSLKNSSGDETCVGSFQPITTGAGSDYDVILGMAFLRNVYVLTNYGDYVDEATARAPPYVQLLSITDPAAAHLDFVNTRLGGTDTTDMQRLTAGTPVTDNSTSFFNRRWRSIIIIALVSFTIFVLALAVTLLYFRSRRRNRRFVQGTVPSTVDIDTGFSYGHSMYRPLEHPAPSGEIRPVQGYNSETGRISARGLHAETAPGHLPTRDFYAESTQASVTPTHEEDHSMPPPRYEVSDPWSTR